MPPNHQGQQNAASESLFLKGDLWWRSLYVQTRLLVHLFNKDSLEQMQNIYDTTVCFKRELLCLAMHNEMNNICAPKSTTAERKHYLIYILCTRSWSCYLFCNFSLLMDDHLGHRHIWVLLLGFFDGLYQNLKKNDIKDKLI